MQSLSIGRSKWSCPHWIQNSSRPGVIPHSLLIRQCDVCRSPDPQDDKQLRRWGSQVLTVLRRVRKARLLTSCTCVAPAGDVREHGGQDHVPGQEGADAGGDRRGLPPRPPAPRRHLLRPRGRPARPPGRHRGPVRSSIAARTAGAQPFVGDQYLRSAAFSPGFVLSVSSARLHVLARPKLPLPHLPAFVPLQADCGSLVEIPGFLVPAIAFPMMVGPASPPPQAVYGAPGQAWAAPQGAQQLAARPPLQLHSQPQQQRASWSAVRPQPLPQPILSHCDGAAAQGGRMPACACLSKGEEAARSAI